MSLRRLNTLAMTGVLPFNFGTDYDGWVSIYKTFPELCGSDPATWPLEQREKVNAQAKAERDLCDRLMAMPDDEFYAEVERLAVEDA